MSDIIKLLPDAVANQIAAGEVIQRPASAIKELVENAIDAGADNIRLIVKDAGRTLIQVIDNGSGMSDTDARISFERHATSKISNANDLFTIRTMGFRGEALASICAIAHVEMKTRRETDTLGTHIINEGSAIKSQELCACEKGTSIAVKNLFFNVPARRNFLKSDQVELRHINDEFLRVALSHPDIAFTYFHNGSEMYHLPKSNLKKRIVACFGNPYNDKLVSIEHVSDMVSFSGFISKPEAARKTRGEQFFFTNRRFMKHNYLNHAVFNAYDELIKKDTFPSFFIFIEIDPEQIDVNIHPTKTEIKFQDERLIYSFLNATVKKALGMHNVLPSLDFTTDTNFDVTPRQGGVYVPPPEMKISPNFNPFDTGRDTSPKHTLPNERSNKDNWQKLYDELARTADPVLPDEPSSFGNSNSVTSLFETNDRPGDDVKMLLLHNRFVAAQVKSGMMLVDKQAALERILFEKYLLMLDGKGNASQQLLFPHSVEFSPADAELITELNEELRSLGFELLPTGSNSFDVIGTPPDLQDDKLQHTFEKMLENFKSNRISLKLGRNENMAAAFSRQVAAKQTKPLVQEEMNGLIDSLFACENPYYTPYGKSTVCIIKTDDIENLFKLQQ